MDLKWNDIAAIRGYYLNGMTVAEIYMETVYSTEDITKVIEDLKKELENELS